MKKLIVVMILAVAMIVIPVSSVMAYGDGGGDGGGDEVNTEDISPPVGYTPIGMSAWNPPPNDDFITRTDSVGPPPTHGPHGGSDMAPSGPQAPVADIEEANKREPKGPKGPEYPGIDGPPDIVFVPVDDKPPQGTSSVRATPTTNSPPQIEEPTKREPKGPKGPEYPGIDGPPDTVFAPMTGGPPGGTSSAGATGTTHGPHSGDGMAPSGASSPVAIADIEEATKGPEYPGIDGPPDTAFVPMGDTPPQGTSPVKATRTTHGPRQWEDMSPAEQQVLIAISGMQEDAMITAGGIAVGYATGGCSVYTQAAAGGAYSGVTTYVSNSGKPKGEQSSTAFSVAKDIAIAFIPKTTPGQQAAISKVVDEVKAAVMEPSP